MYKDEVLNQLAEDGFNVAQFVSYGLDGMPRFMHIANQENINTEDWLTEPCHIFQYLINNTPNHSINIRSFHPDKPKGNPFHYGITSAILAEDIAHDLVFNQKLYVIVNETVDIKDGGVSGVFLPGICEFAPGDTPRCVEKPGCASVSDRMGYRMLTQVYNIQLPTEFLNDDLDIECGNIDNKYRYEFSIHPVARGCKGLNYILWEREIYDGDKAIPSWTTPNLFSNFIGDKIYGLLVANFSTAARVPHGIVIGRNVAPFEFGFRVNSGASKGRGNAWLRTAPYVQVPGKFTTVYGWQDPFKILQTEDPEGSSISSVIYQDAVKAEYAGSLVTSMIDDTYIIEGVKGNGDVFMVGKSEIETLPEELITNIKNTADNIRKRLDIPYGIRFEWVYDGKNVYIVQFHIGSVLSSGNTVYPGSPKKFVDFNVSDGLENLRKLVENTNKEECGVNLIGNVGITSHFGDILRKAQIPSKISR